ncbi:MAG: efflux RND transporter permease subunit, partial [Xanthomonadales bacterium]|nr:efflux RND transporter permease subunit [Xanthomonadales bacterium]
RREAGLSPLQASIAAADRVRGSLLASTATTVAIFIPVLFLEGVEGQLFADLALTIAIAVAISMLVALTVLPTAARLLLRDRSDAGSAQAGGNLPTERVVNTVMALTGTPRRRWAWIGGLIGGGALLTWALLPSLDYLPPVKRDAVDVFVNPPPGLPAEMAEKEIFLPIIERLRPYMDGEKEPALRNYYVLGWPGGGNLGIRAKDQNDVKQLEQIVRNEIISGFPDVRAFAAQGNLFGGMANDRSIAIHLQSRDVEALAEAAREGQRLLTESFPGAVVNAFPPPDFAAPEIRVRPNDRRLSEVGWTRQDVAQVIRAFGDGVWLGEHFDGEHRLDILLRAEGWDGPEALARAPVATPGGAIVPLGELVEFEQAVGPASLRRVDGRRTITVAVSPPEDMSLEQAMDKVRAEVEPGLREVLPADGSLRYGGSADSLAKAMVTMAGNFAIALVLLLMLMAALFRSLKDSALVMLTVPLATVGGVVGLQLANLITFQPLDLLTMIGFVILLGLTVNNAILLVDRTRANQREGADRDEAVRAAVAERLRPILMSTTTTLLGMLPLVLIPGPGSVIYRGLAVVIVGGMSLSLLFTLVLLPAMLRLGDLVWLPRRNTPPAGEPALTGDA